MPPLFDQNYLKEQVMLLGTQKQIDSGLFVLRVAIGVFMLVHGTQKLMGFSEIADKFHGKLLAETICDWGFDARSSVVAGPRIGDSLLSCAIQQPEKKLVASSNAVTAPG